MRSGAAGRDLPQDNVWSSRSIRCWKKTRDRRCGELADRTDSPSTTVFRVIKDDLELTRLCARWIPRLLTQDMKDARVSMCQANLQRVEEVGGLEHFRDLIVTGDEIWVPFFDPPTKQESMVNKVIIFVFEI